ncbi:hypothetical protein EAE89_08230 [Photorhabdus heterorhabditis]|nr:hypothetical protein [Photorhabdus heterorhabditis]
MFFSRSPTKLELKRCFLIEIGTLRILRWFISPEQPTINLFAVRIDTKNTHGTRCILSAVITALMANRLS